MSATKTRRERVERIPVWSASGYLTLARVNTRWARLHDDERLVLEVLNEYTQGS
jgi:hypothetical protein